MDELKMHTPNRADENFKKLAALFPNAVTETINEVVRGTFGKHEIENNTRLKEVALDANGYGTG